MKKREAQPGVVVRNLDNEHVGTIVRVYHDWQGVPTALVAFDNGLWAATVKRLAKSGRKERVSA